MQIPLLFMIFSVFAGFGFGIGQFLYSPKSNQIQSEVLTIRELRQNRQARIAMASIARATARQNQPSPVKKQTPLTLRQKIQATAANRVLKQKLGNDSTGQKLFDILSVAILDENVATPEEIQELQERQLEDLLANPEETVYLIQSGLDRLQIGDDRARFGLISLLGIISEEVGSSEELRGVALNELMSKPAPIRQDPLTATDEQAKNLALSTSFASAIPLTAYSIVTRELANTRDAIEITFDALVRQPDPVTRSNILTVFKQQNGQDQIIELNRLLSEASIDVPLFHQESQRLPANLEQQVPEVEDDI